MKRYLLAGLLVTLFAEPLVTPSVADADCPDSHSVMCSKLPALYPHSYRTLPSSVGRCSDTWAICKVSHCSHWQENLIKQCRELLQAEHGTVSYFDWENDNYRSNFSY